MFTIVKLWKQPRCPMTDELIKKMWYIYTMKFYSAIKKNEIMLFAGKWIELENFMLSEVKSQAQNVKGHMFSLICGSRAYKLNAYIDTYMIIHIHTYIYSERENKIY
jgi:hypothetical protein